MTGPSFRESDPMHILPFAGYRYTTATGELDRIAAPPFDQINDRERDRLHALSPHQFAQLTRPTAGKHGDPHTHSAALHRGWLADAVVARDREPALYPYAIELQDGGRRVGLCCLVSVAPGTEGDVRPHELTVAKPLAERLWLLVATRVDLEPVMFLADDPDAALERLLQENARGTELGAHRDVHGVRHALYRVADPARIARYRALLSSRHAVIADGHHRTKVAQLFAERHRPAAGTAAAAKLAVLFSLASSALRIDPIHRAVVAALDPEPLRALAHRRTVFSGDGGRAFAQAVARAEQPALGVRFARAAAEIWLLDTERVPQGMPGGGTRLPAVLLHHQLLPAAGLGIESATDGRVLYRDDPEEPWTMARDGGCSAAFFLPPMSPAEFAAATRDGSVLPPKSTRFLPKLVSGLVWAGHDAPVA